MVARKTSKGWTVYSHRTGKKLGTYATKAEAEAAIRRHRRFRKRRRR